MPGLFVGPAAVGRWLCELKLGAYKQLGDGIQLAKNSTKALLANVEKNGVQRLTSILAKSNNVIGKFYEIIRYPNPVASS